MRRAIVVEDVAPTREWLARMVVAAFPGCAVHACGSVAEAGSAIAEDAFDLALLDLGLPDGSGMDVLRLLTGNGAQTLCVITTLHGNDEHVLPALAAGAMGYLLKEQPEELQVRQLRQLADGIPALSPPIARRMLAPFRAVPASAPQDAGLTTRESEVLTLIAQGLRVAEVARNLGLTDNTVAGYVKSIYQKLGISSRAEAATQAARLGLLR